MKQNQIDGWHFRSVATQSIAHRKKIQNSAMCMCVYDFFFHHLSILSNLEFIFVFQNKIVK